MNELKVLGNNNLYGGIWVCGNYITEGVEFPDCVTFGYEHAKIVAEYLNKNKNKNKMSGTTTEAAKTTMNNAKNDLKVPTFNLSLERGK
jgi:hypothetical protein